MNRRKEVIILLLILIIALGLRIYSYDEEYYGEDYFYHYSIVEQSLERGRLSSQNDLVICYTGIKGGHPVGYYSLPYMLGKIMNLDVAFAITAILFGLITILVFYWLIRLLFGVNVALWSAFFVATSLGHIIKSIPQTYRGDNLIYPFILLSLALLYKMYKEGNATKRLKYAMGAGVVSGFGMIMWNGYILLIVIYLFTIFLYLTYNFFNKYKTKVEEIKASAVSVGAQAVMMLFLFLLFDFYAKGHDFFKYYYFIILIGVFSYLYVLSLCTKKKSYAPLVFYSILAIIIILVFWDKMYNLYSGFGSVKRVENIALEMLKPAAEVFYFYFFITIILAVVGLFKLIRLDEKKIFFLGLLLPSAYLVISASRFLFFFSLPLAVLAALFINGKFIVNKKYDLMNWLKICVLILLLFYPIYQVPKIITWYDEVFVDGLNFIKEKTPKDACIITYPNKAASIEFFSKRPIYGNSLGYVKERRKKISSFLLSDEKPSFNIPKGYLLVADIDLTYIDTLAVESDKNLSGNIAILSRIAENVYSTYERNISFMYIEEEDNKNFYQIYNEKLYPVKKAFVDGVLYDAGEGIGCVYINEENEKYKTFLYFGTKLCETNIFKIMTGQEVPGLEKIYFNKGVVIHKITNDQQRR